jgi:hypothetical protein
MDSEQLRYVITCDDMLRKFVKGVFAADEALIYIAERESTTTTRPWAFIVNTDVAVYVGSETTSCIEILDSLGVISRSSVFHEKLHIL